MRVPIVSLGPPMNERYVRLTHDTEIYLPKEVIGDRAFDIEICVVVI
jgi:hypothetical protein